VVYRFGRGPSGFPAATVKVTKFLLASKRCIWVVLNFLSGPQSPNGRPLRGGCRRGDSGTGSTTPCGERI